MRWVIQLKICISKSLASMPLFCAGIINPLLSGSLIWAGHAPGGPASAGSCVNKVLVKGHCPLRWLERITRLGDATGTLTFSLKYVMLWLMFSPWCAALAVSPCQFLSFVSQAPHCSGKATHGHFHLHVRLRAVSYDTAAALYHGTASTAASILVHLIFPAVDKATESRQ